MQQNNCLCIEPRTDVFKSLAIYIIELFEHNYRMVNNIRFFIEYRKSCSNVITV